MDEPVIRAPGDGEQLAMGATHGEIKAAHADTRGRFALIDTVFAPGFRGPPPHRHREMHDSFYVIDGALVFHVDGRRVEAGPGTLVVVPPGVVHTFTNEGAEPARVLNLFSPAGLEDYLRELSALGRASDPATMAELASRYDFELADG
jgi:quercetin dioxygenase-like cupin family protein